MDYIENRKIYLTETIYNRLKNDAQLFDIYKRDKHTVNLNMFLNKLLAGYYDEYSEECSNIRNAIVDELDHHSVNDSYNIATSILNQIILHDLDNSSETKSKTVSFKPIKNTILLVEQIEKELNPYDTFSSYFRRMVSKYCEKPIYEREQVIFKDTLSSIQTAIRTKRIILFNTIWNAKKIHEAIPYEICVGQDENHNYLLCADIDPNSRKQTVKTIRLNRIASIKTSNKGDALSPEILENLKLTKKYGSQHEINTNTPIVVKLNNYGLIAYNRIYTDRPKYEGSIQMDNDGRYVLNFLCSEEQIYLYFGSIRIPV